jgi:D-serine deaminase-like pyridoxal phosphate-dependent protein
MVERDAVLEAADRIRAAGVRCDGVSVGSTPTACTGIDLTGITEFRPGVYMFMDLYQAGIGVCDVDDIAVSVLTSVIGHRPDGVIIDAGALALSADRSTSHLPVDLGYGQACTLEGEPIDGLTVEAVTQEHGIARSARPEDYPIGTLLRILPNHACITAAGHAGYHVVEGNTVQAYWNRVGGW